MERPPYRRFVRTGLWRHFWRTLKHFIFRKNVIKSNCQKVGVGWGWGIARGAKCSQNLWDLAANCRTAVNDSYYYNSGIMYCKNNLAEPMTRKEKFTRIASTNCCRCRSITQAGNYSRLSELHAKSRYVRPKSQRGLKCCVTSRKLWNFHCP
jgi:hypothetical protein